MVQYLTEIGIEFSFFFCELRPCCCWSNLESVNSDELNISPCFFFSLLLSFFSPLSIPLFLRFWNRLVGVIRKRTFSLVNTSSRNSASLPRRVDFPSVSNNRHPFSNFSGGVQSPPATNYPVTRIMCPSLLVCWISARLPPPLFWISFLHMKIFIVYSRICQSCLYESRRKQIWR